MAGPAVGSESMKRYEGFVEFRRDLRYVPALETRNVEFVLAWHSFSVGTGQCPAP